MAESVVEFTPVGGARVERVDGQLFIRQDPNDSGMIPVDYQCVIRLEEAEETTEGGIIIPPSRRSRSQMAHTTATLLAVGGNAFNDWTGAIPRVGDQIIVQKYAGQFKEANPEDTVRIVRDKEILAICTD